MITKFNLNYKDENYLNKYDLNIELKNGKCAHMVVKDDGNLWAMIYDQHGRIIDQIRIYFEPKILKVRSTIFEKMAK